MRNACLRWLTICAFAFSVSTAFSAQGAGSATVTGSSAAEPIRAPLITEAEPLQLPPITHHTLANGLDLWIVERHQQPTALFHLVLPVGSLNDPPGREGLAAFTTEMLRHGTQSRTAEEIASTIEFVGGSLTTAAGEERLSVTAHVLAKDAALALALMADVVLHPTFADSEIEILRPQLMGALRQQQDDPFSLVGQHAASMFYGKEHPLGRRQSLASLGAITRDDLVAFHARHFVPEGARLVVVGNVNPEWVRSETERLFGFWGADAAAAPAPVSPPNPPTSGESRVRWVHKPELTQVHIRLQQGGPARTDEDWLAVTAFNYILGGGGFSSRLMRVVRSELGQTYGIWTSYDAFKFPGSMHLGTFTRNETVWETLTTIERELERFWREGVTEDEVALAKSHLIGAFPLRLETLGDMAGVVARTLHYEGNLDYLREYRQRIAALTKEQLNAAIRKHLDPKHFVVVLLGNAAVLDQAPDTVFGVNKDAIEVVAWGSPID